jgi:hypothetical protein
VGKAVDPPAKGALCAFLPQRNDLDLFSCANYLRRAATVWRMLRPVRRSRTQKFCR